MKISRRDLRKIILKSLNEKKILKEVTFSEIGNTLISAERNPDNQDLIDKLQKYSENLRTDLDSNSGPFENKGTRTYRAAKELLDAIEKFLESPGPIEDLPKISDVNANIVVAEEEPAAPEWKKYGSETDWEYKIQGESPNEIWVTKKAGGDGKVFRLNNSRYKTTVEKLDKDDSMPKRSPQSKANDPALRSTTASSSSKRSSKSTDTGDQPNNASVTSTSIDERAAIWLKNLEKEGKISVLAVPKEKLESEGKGPDLTSVKTLDTALASLKKLEVTNDKGIIRDLHHPETGDVGSKVDMYFDRDRKVLKIDGPRLTNYELTGYSEKKIGEKIYIVANNYQYFVPASQELGAAALGMPINENKVVYGESHATLIRKRYWGRY